MRVAVSLFLGAAACLVLPRTAAAETLRVGPRGPHTTIASAVAAASAGDTILIARGLYVETVEIATPGLTLRAARGVEWQPGELDGGCVLLDQSAAGVTLQGILFRGAGTAVLALSDDVAVLKCRFRGGRLAIGVLANRPRVSKCDLRQGVSGVELIGDGAVIERCTVSGTRAISVRVTGHDAVVSRCTVRLVDDDPCVSVTGDRATIERNRLGVTEDDGVRLTGDDAVIARNDIRLVKFRGVSLTGDGALIERNAVRVAGQGGVDVTGDGCSVRGNRVEDVMEEAGIIVRGRDALVDGNSVSGLAQARGIDVSGAAFDVVGNRVLDAGYGSVAIVVDTGSGEPEPAHLRDNLALGSTAHGFTVAGSGVVVSGNRAEDCSELGFDVSGDRHALVDNVAIGIGQYGFHLRAAADVSLTECVAADCARDGFRIESDSSGVALTGCRATGSGRDGLHNSGVTTFTSCTFSRNRQDVGSDAGTLTDGGGNAFTTGGVDAPPVD